MIYPAKFECISAESLWKAAMKAERGSGNEKWEMGANKWGKTRFWKSESESSNDFYLVLASQCNQKWHKKIFMPISLEVIWSIVRPKWLEKILVSTINEQVIS